MTGAAITRRLRRLYDTSPVRDLGESQRLVVVSDLHLGDGGKLDDFRNNGDLLHSAMKDFYLPENFHLVLNGDIEELQRFSAERVRSRWKELLELFSLFQAGAGLTRLVGNHDTDPGPFFAGADHPGRSLRLRGDSGEIFIFHGHQASRLGPLTNWIVGKGLRWVASPLGIRNYTVAFNSRHKYRYEKRVYRFARSRRVLAIIGHTHRPLFESMSRLDTLKMRIESACRRLAREPAFRLEEQVRQMKGEYFQLTRTRHKYAGQSMLYHRGLLVPCLFNSGCGIGSGGVTALEIDNRRINLVLWFHSSRNRRYMETEGRRASRLGDKDIYRVVLKTDSLDYIQTRIRLLS